MRSLGMSVSSTKKQVFVLIYAPALSPGPQLHRRATDAHTTLQPARATPVLLDNPVTRAHETGLPN
jgi:hypothetical protein